MPVRTLAIDFRANLASLQRAMNGAAGPIKKLGQQAKSAFAAIGVGVAVASAAVAAMGAQVLALGSRGAGIADVSREFGILSKNIGSTADAMLGALRRGMAGTVSDFQLMEKANRAMGAGLNVTSAQMEQLAVGARLLAKRAGTDTVTAFDRLTNAMATGRTTSLKSLGLFVDMRAAILRYQEETGKLTREMTDADRAAAIQAETLSSLQKVISDAGHQSRDFGEVLVAVKTGITNFTDALAVAISESPVLMAALNSLAGAFESAFGPHRERAIALIVGVINQAVIAMAGLVTSGIRVGQSFLRMAANVHGWAASVDEAVASALEFASALPGVGSHLADMAKSARSSAERTRELQARYTELADGAGSAADTVAEFGAMLTEAADTARDEMEPATRSVETAARDVVPALEAESTSLERVERVSETAAEKQETFAEMVRRVQAETDRMNALYQQSGDLIQGVEANTQLYGTTLASTTTVMADMSGAALPTLKQEYAGLMEQLQASESVFEGVKANLMGLKERFLDFGNVTSGLFEGVFGPGGFIANIAAQGMSKLTGLIGQGLGWIGGQFKKLFGGPSAEELAGREIVENWQGNIAQMLSDTQLIEAGHELWKKVNIGVRDAYLEVGISEQQAMADVQALYDAIKQGPEAVNPLIAQIEERMRGLGSEIQDASQSIDDMMRNRTAKLSFDIDQGNIPADIAAKLKIPGMREGGMGRVTGPALFAVERGVTEEFAFSGAGRTLSQMDFGADDRAHSLSELRGLRRDIRTLPLALAGALASQ